MLKLLVILLIFLDGVYMCRWVCIDKNNNIKKRYFNQTEVTLEIPKREITLPEIPKKGRRRIPIPGEKQCFIISSQHHETLN